MLRDKATLHRFRQFRHRFLHPRNPGILDHQRRQVGIGKVAVVLRVFLAAHRPRLVSIRIVQARFLHNRAAVFDQRDLTAHFEVDRLLHEAEAVEVLDFAARAELVAPERRTETLASQRKLPSCMLPSQMPIHAHQAVQLLRRRRSPPRSCASPAPTTISSSGVPARLRSMPLMP